MTDFQSKYTGQEIESRLDASPFEGSVTEHFSSSETPNPLSFVSTELGFSFHKIFNTPITSDGNVAVTINGFPLVPELVQPIGEYAVAFVGENNVLGTFMSVAFYKSGDVPIDMGFGFTLMLNVPEIGTYAALPPDAKMPDGLVCDLSGSVIKKLDPKFLPSTLPEVTTEDSGKILSVDSNGQWVATAISEWSGGSY